MVTMAHNASQKMGYKQTKVGEIPEDWGVSTVGAEFEVQLGKMLDAEKNTGLPKPYLGNKAVQWNSIDIDNLQTMAMSHSDLQRFRLCYGDLLVCEGGEVGRAAIWEAPIEECYYQKALHRLRPLRGFNPHLMLALLRYWIDHEKLADYVSQTSIAHLTREKFIEVPLPVPTSDEQQAIATALSDVDALIASLDKLIAKKRAIKQATMQQLLTGKRRLPGFSGEWEVKTFGDVMTGFASGATPSRNRPDFFKGDIRWITSGELNYNLIMDTIEKLSVEAVSKANLKLLPKGTFLIAITGLEAEGTRGSCGIVGAEATTNQSCMALFPTKNLSMHYLFHYYVYKGKSLALEYCQGTKQQSYTGKVVKLLPILLPPFEEQQAIAAVLADMDAEIVVLERRRDKTRALKQGMMQELLTGKTRLI